MISSPLEHYEEGKDFWKKFPAWTQPPIYKKLYEEDTSKGKKESSKLMWALIFFFDKSEYNPYKNTSDSERKELIAMDILEDPEFNWEGITRIFEFTSKIMLTDLERTYYALIATQDKRTELLTTTSYNVKNAKILDDVMKSSDAIRKEIDKLREAVENQSEAAKTKGNLIESAREKGLF